MMICFANQVWYLGFFKKKKLNAAFLGSEFHYTTHGYTVLSAVIEAAAKEPFVKHIKKMFKTLGLNNTYVDENEPLIPYRAK